jgi:hypothetical protein
MTLTKVNFWQYYKKRFCSLVVPYLMASVVAGFLSKKNILFSIVNFNAAGPYYFIAFFLQLILVAPLLNKFNLLFLPLVMGLAFYSNSWSMTNLWGGGEFLLGGSFLFLFLLGMIFYKKREYFKPKKGWALVGILLILVLEFGELMIKTWHNPPEILTMVYTLAIFMIFYNWKLNKENLLVKMFVFLGKYSLYIFLYHVPLALFINICFLKMVI